jgi:SAM-dependent methyltransferase
MWSVSYGKCGVMERALVFEREFILKSARQRLQSTNLAEIFIRQAYSELRFVIRNRVTFRKRRNREACKAYRAMGSREFEAINARQQWANWRLIPKNLSGHVPANPMTAIDLCCGTGHSTEVLSWYLPRGSRILGIDYSPTFVEKARARSYLHFEGESVDVSFQVQSVLETFKDAEGKRIADESVDLINSCGAVGCHFDREATEILAKEVARVLRPGGLAAIDSGAPGTPKDLLVSVFQAAGFRASHARKSVFLDPYTQVCFRKI